MTDFSHIKVTIYKTTTDHPEGLLSGLDVTTMGNTPTENFIVGLFITAVGNFQNIDSIPTFKMSLKIVPIRNATRIVLPVAISEFIVYFSGGYSFGQCSGAVGTVDETEKVQNYTLLHWCFGNL